MNVSEPRTAAGRALLESGSFLGPYWEADDRLALATTIAAIEDQAARLERERLGAGIRAALDELGQDADREGHGVVTPDYPAPRHPLENGYCIWHERDPEEHGCDTATVLAAHDAALAREDALAEALRRHVDLHWTHGTFEVRLCGLCAPDLAALAVHEEARR